MAKEQLTVWQKVGIGMTIGGGVVATAAGVALTATGVGAGFGAPLISMGISTTANGVGSAIRNKPVSPLGLAADVTIGAVTGGASAAIGKAVAKEVGKHVGQKVVTSVISSAASGIGGNVVHGVADGVLHADPRRTLESLHPRRMVASAVGGAAAAALGDGVHHAAESIVGNAEQMTRDVAYVAYKGTTGAVGAATGAAGSTMVSNAIEGRSITENVGKSSLVAAMSGAAHSAAGAGRQVKDRRDRKKEIKRYERELDEKIKRSKELEKHFREEEESLKRHAQESDELAQQLEKANAERDAALKTLDQKKQDLEYQQKQSELALAKAEEKAKRLQADIDRSKKALSQKRQQFEQAEAALHKAEELARLQQEMEQKKHALEQAERQRAEAESQPKSKKETGLKRVGGDIARTFKKAGSDLAAERQRVLDTVGKKLGPLQADYENARAATRKLETEARKLGVPVDRKASDLLAPLRQKRDDALKHWQKAEKGFEITVVKHKKHLSNALKPVGELRKEVVQNAKAAAAGVAKDMQRVQAGAQKEINHLLNKKSGSEGRYQQTREKTDAAAKKVDEYASKELEPAKRVLRAANEPVKVLTDNLQKRLVDPVTISLRRATQDISEDTRPLIEPVEKTVKPHLKKGAEHVVRGTTAGVEGALKLGGHVAGALGDDATHRRLNEKADHISRTSKSYAESYVQVSEQVVTAKTAAKVTAAAAGGLIGGPLAPLGSAAATTIVQTAQGETVDGKQIATNVIAAGAAGCAGDVVAGAGGGQMAVGAAGGFAGSAAGYASNELMNGRPVEGHKLLENGAVGAASGFVGAGVSEAGGGDISAAFASGITKDAVKQTLEGGRVDMGRAIIAGSNDAAQQSYADVVRNTGTFLSSDTSHTHHAYMNKDGYLIVDGHIVDNMDASTYPVDGVDDTQHRPYYDTLNEKGYMDADPGAHHHGSHEGTANDGYIDNEELHRLIGEQQNRQSRKASPSKYNAPYDPFLGHSPRWEDQYVGDINPIPLLGSGQNDLLINSGPARKDNAHDKTKAMRHATGDSSWQSRGTSRLTKAGYNKRYNDARAQTSLDDITVRAYAPKASVMDLIGIFNDNLEMYISMRDAQDAARVLRYGGCYNGQEGGYFDYKQPSYTSSEHENTLRKEQAACSVQNQVEIDNEWQDRVDKIKELSGENYSDDLKRISQLPLEKKEGLAQLADDLIADLQARLAQPDSFQER